MVKNQLLDYKGVIRPQNIDEIQLLAEKLHGKKVKMVNSTATGGGVAEILIRLVPLLNELGIVTKWDVIKGSSAFFGVTKNFHNALHGKEVEITDSMFDVFRENNEINLRELDFSKDDIVIIHDPQPAGLIAAKDKSSAWWAWRCHIDVSNPFPAVWEFVKSYVEQYDASIFSTPQFSKNLSIPQYMIYPSIDPLAEKNRELSSKEINDELHKLGLNRNKPIITQISRFDRLKDPLGVVDAFKMVRKNIDCQLVLAGGGASDDPEGAVVLAEVKERAGNDPDIHILLLPPFSDLAINALQRASAIVVQKSLKEGFALTVTEALWKGKAVIGSSVGGIPLQIINNVTGVLVHSVEGCAYQMKYLLNNPQVAKKLGQYGREHVREKFLLTTHLRNYLLLFLALYHPGRGMIQL